MIVKIAGLGIVTVFSALVVRGERPDVAAAIGIAGGVAVLLCVAEYFTDVAKLLAELAEKTGVGGDLVLYMLKTVGAGYVVEFACDTAEDAKMTSLANKISVAGKILIFCLTIPIIVELVEVIAALAEYGG